MATKRSKTRSSSGKKPKQVRKPRAKSEAQLFLERLDALRSKITAAAQVTERDQHLRELLDAARACPEKPKTRSAAAAILLGARAGLKHGDKRAALVFKAAQLDIESRHIVLAEAPDPSLDDDASEEALIEDKEPSRAVA